MTVQADYNIQTYAGNGVTKEFTIPFKFFNEEIAVYKNKTFETYVKNVDYMIIRNETGGKIIFESAPQSGDLVTIVRSIPLNQLVTFIEGEDFPASDYEYSLDRIIMALQEMKGNIQKIAIPPACSSLEDFFKQFASKDDLNDYYTKEQIKNLYLKKSDFMQKFNDRTQIYNSVTIHNNWIEVEDMGDFKYASSSSIFLNSLTYYASATVTFYLEQAMSGNFAPIADLNIVEENGSYSYSVKVYAKEPVSGVFDVAVTLF